MSRTAALNGFFVGIVVTSVLLSFLSPPVLAGIVPIYQFTDGESASYRWTYGALVGEHERVEDGDFFVIYDFVGFSGGHSEPSGWVFTPAYAGPTQGFHVPDDDPNILNLAWTYMGTNPIPGFSYLGVFDAISDIDNFGSDSFLGRATGNGGSLEGKRVFAGGVITVPKAAMSLPEPTLACIAGLILTLIRRERKTSRRLGS